MMPIKAVGCSHITIHRWCRQYSVLDNETKAQIGPEKIKIAYGMT